MEDAEVVCQHLGCGSAAGAYLAVEIFGTGHGPVSLARVDCKGNESTLWDCEIRGWGPYNYSHEWDTAVTCQGFSRLVGGDGACAGRLEVRQGRAWVGVCEDQVDMKVAQVVCRELGCGAALSIPGSERFGAGSGPLWGGGFQCNGTEPLLSACARHPPHSQGCSTGPASVICSPYTGFRLGNSSSGCTGRVEVAVRGTWGSVCASEWELADAHVLCRHLGCGRAFTVPPGGSFGSGDGPLRPDAFGCSGSERHPGECPVAVLGKPPCAPGNAAAVNCSGVGGFVDSLRLVGGQSLCDGWLEETITSPAWRRVPVEQWNSWDFHMVCAVLGCGVPKDVYTSLGMATVVSSSPSEMGVMTEEMDVLEMGSALTSSSEKMDDVVENVDDVSGMGPAPTSSTEGMVIVCSGSRRVRLVGSSGRCAGRVEVYSSGTWSAVCQEGWDLRDAAVVCRELGCGTALQAPSSARFGPGTGPLWPYIPDCSGTEESLWECGRSERRECGRGGGAGAVCSEQLSVRLAGGRGRCRGFLEVSHNGTWGRVCANGTSPGTANTVCQQLGCGDRGWLSAFPAQQPAPAWLAWVGCEDGARSLWGCPSAPWNLQSCDPGGDAHVACDEDSDGITETDTTPHPDGATSTGVRGSTAAAVTVGTVPVPTVLCVVLGTLLCVALGALAVLLCRARAWRRGPGRAADAISNAVYEELDYTAMPEYQEVPSRPGSLSEGSVKKLPYYTGDSVEGSDTEGTPGPLGHCHGPLCLSQSPLPGLSTEPRMATMMPWVWHRSPLLPALGTSLRAWHRGGGSVSSPQVGSTPLRVPQEPPGPARNSPRCTQTMTMSAAAPWGRRHEDAAALGTRVWRCGGALSPGRGGPAHRGHPSLCSSAGKQLLWPSPQAPQRAGGMPQLLAELQDAVGSQLVVPQVQAGSGFIEGDTCDRGMGNLGWKRRGSFLKRAAAELPGAGAAGQGQRGAAAFSVAAQVSGAACGRCRRREPPGGNRLLPALAARRARGRSCGSSAMCQRRREGPGSRQLPPPRGLRARREGSTPRTGASGSAGSGELRLVGGGGRCAGRVEVKHGGEWGSVCVFDFDWEARWAIVVCRQLGCGRVAKASTYAPFGQGSGRIWLQPFFCRGTEEALEECPHFGWGQHFCGHESDVGVTCRDAVELRLAGGGTPCAGRVEVKLRGRWGSVGDDNWDMEDAEVVCQHLGCGSAAGAYSALEIFGAGHGPVSLAVVDCKGNESTLWDCEIRGWGPYGSIHVFDTAVTCQGFSRLVGGDGACAGRLEVRQGRAWVGVCEDQVDMKVAQVVCRELGCGAALSIPGSERFGAGSGPLWGGGFQCNGTEPLLSACARHPPHSQGCSTGPASVICSPYTGFRLGNSSSGCTGRVEVAVRGTWGSVCASEWELADAHVLCRHLGCGRAFTVPPGGSFGSGDGPLRPDAFGCSGSERHPGECPVAVLGKPPCAPGNAAAVNCSGVGGFVESLRLVGGQSLCDGWLEETITSPAWRRVPVEQWNSWDIHMVCSVLGCGVPMDVYTSLGMATVMSSSPSEMDVMTEEMDVLEIASVLTSSSEKMDDVVENMGNVSGMGPAPTSSTEGMVLVCSGSRRVRLVGSSGRCAGRVEVYSSGTWSTVCQEGWDLRDAAVVCRELGCGTALQVPSSARFGPGTGPLWPYIPDCSGTEESLWECGRSERRECGRGGGAGAVCSEQLSVRLAGGRGRCRGFLEVSHNGTWGRVCANGTSPGTANTVCQQLGCGDRGWLSAFPAQQPAPAWLAWVGCEDGARSLWGCPSAPWNLQSCGPGGDAHVACDGDRDGITETDTTPHPDGATSTDVRGSTAAAVTVGTVPVPTVLCVVLGTLLCVALGALAVLLCRARAWRRGPGRAADAISNAVYEELDYTAMPEYQEVPSRPGSLSEGSVKKLPYYTGDSVEGSDTEGTPGVRGSTAAAVTVGTVPVPTVLCVVLGTLLCLALGALAVLLCRARAWRRGPGRAADAISNAVYEELDYTAMPEYQVVPSRPGSLSEGSVKKLPYYTGDSVEGSDTEGTPEPPAWPEHGTPDGYDDALGVAQEPPAPSTGDVSGGVAQRRWICVLPTGGIYSPPSAPGVTRTGSEQPPVHTDYDDVGSSALGPSP
ncbi:antigen WC1.1-like [Cyanocitta cristata]